MRLGVERQVLANLRHVETDVNQTGRSQPHIETARERQHVLKFTKQHRGEQGAADREAADLPEPLLHAIESG
jgi:hypothetical protein